MVEGTGLPVLVGITGVIIKVYVSVPVSKSSTFMQIRHEEFSGPRAVKQATEESARLKKRVSLDGLDAGLRAQNFRIHSLLRDTDMHGPYLRVLFLKRLTGGLAESEEQRAQSRSFATLIENRIWWTAMKVTIDGSKRTLRILSSKPCVVTDIPKPPAA